MAAKTASPARKKVFTKEERDAMQDRAREQRGVALDGEAGVLEKIRAMVPADRAMAERIHALVKQAAPGLEPRLWYGMPAYSKNGKVLCFFQSGQKFKTRYATFGFSDTAKLDAGNMWPNSYALLRLTPADEARIAALVKQAAG